VSFDVDHGFVDTLGAAFPTTKELDQVVGQRRIAELNAHAAAVPFF
jgi:hypothetical protein